MVVIRSEWRREVAVGSRDRTACKYMSINIINIIYFTIMSFGIARFGCWSRRLNPMEKIALSNDRQGLGK